MDHEFIAFCFLCVDLSGNVPCYYAKWLGWVLIGIEAIFELGKTAIERIWPDPHKRAEELRKLEELKQKGDLAELDGYVKILLAQIKVNEKAAESKHWFVAAARPAVIWICASSLAFTGIIHPLLTWVWAFADMPGEPPSTLDADNMQYILAGLLGIGGMRSFDKSKGTQTDRVSSK